MLDWKTMRANMVECQIRTNGVTDNRVLEALGQIPREKFLPRARQAVAYMGEEIAFTAEPGGASRYLPSPQIFARLLQLAQIDETDLVLDVGCYLGYSAAVLALLAGSVVALETGEELVAKAAELLTEAEIDTVAVVAGPLEAGHRAQAPYDVIIVEQAMDQVPQALLDQLAPGGRLVAIVGTAPVGQARLFVKPGDGDQGGDATGLIASRTAFDVATASLPAAGSAGFEF